MNHTYTRLFTLCALLISAVFPAVGSERETVPQTIETYFNTLQTYQAAFTQMNPDGSRQTGTFYLNRPRQFLWQYANPMPHKLISTGGRMFFIDGDGGQVTQIPLNSGLSGILTQEKFDLSHFKLIEKHEEKGEIGVTVSLPATDELAQGQVTLLLSKNPLRLQELTTINPLGETTRVTFNQIQQNIPLNDKIFDYTPPHEEDYFLN